MRIKEVFGVPTKTCTKCGSGVELARAGMFFGRNKTRVDGFQVWCRVCRVKRKVV